jgi:glutamyl-tRNA reductase
MTLNNSNKKFYNIGISYKKADVYTRGLFSLSPNNQLALLEDAKQKGIALFVLSTCNRTELFGFSQHPYQLIELLCKYSKGTVEEFSKVSYININKDAINHLFRIGTGLESQILGDYEIVGQLKMAFKQAKKQKVTNAFLERLFNSILQASKKVKNQTKLSSGTTSVSYAAVQYIINNLPDYDRKNILVFGLGKMGKHTCKNLAQYTNNKSVCLINRTSAKARDFVKEQKSIRYAEFEALKNEINQCDVLIVSTGADKPTITEQHISKNKKLLVLDLSMPKNVDEVIGTFNSVDLVDLDMLSRITDETLAMRKDEVTKAEAIISDIKDEFFNWLDNRKYAPTIKALKTKLETFKEIELEAFRKKLNGDFNEKQAELISDKIIQKITNQFAHHLKEDAISANGSVELIKKVFQLEDTKKNA